MKTKTIAIAITLSAAASTAQADTVLGLYAGAGQWQSELSGDVGVTDTDFSTLGFDEENNNMFYLALEHPVPVIPNIKVVRTDLSTTGSATLQGNVQFDNVIFPSGTTLATDINLDHTDATFYYEVLDNWINLDLGLTARQYKGQLTASNNDVVPLSETVELDAVIPLVYLKGQIDLPFTGFSLKGEANAIGYSGDSISDISAAIAWQDDFLAVFDLGVELGYRRMNLEIDDLGDLQTDLTIDGPYLSLNAHF
ncbi:TIGR04219 family outer membrane beta-barrel protein [Porticoccus sp. W117]|uniref:TIGR04219 family outer membrane beta-barrel protein n=1 Tax=Porticoccus sp. W117 TaxID=3054777 RepID=UPI0025975C27|nr:TIGR04219 family outer membrane beta-barrel protein [Porticoccus sp. W117]MDM3870085.1 TIGR04219 family outer membrane beta-barrel protein [Porticoccus sp. W117]